MLVPQGFEPPELLHGHAGQPYETVLAVEPYVFLEGGDLLFDVLWGHMIRILSPAAMAPSGALPGMEHARGSARTARIRESDAAPVEGTGPGAGSLACAGMVRSVLSSVPGPQWGPYGEILCDERIGIWVRKRKRGRDLAARPRFTVLTEEMHEAFSGQLSPVAGGRRHLHPEDIVALDGTEHSHASCLFHDAHAGLLERSA